MGRPKKSKPFRYLVRDRSRHKTLRLYYRKGKGKRYRINVDEDHPDFAAHYVAARDGKPLPAPSAALAVPQPDAPEVGTLAALVCDYAKSADFKSLRPQGQRARLGILEACCAEPMKNGKPIGTIPVDRIEPRHVSFLKDRKAGLPGAANNRIKYLRILFGWARIAPNPALDVKMLSPKRKDGHQAWTLADVARYERHHAVGTAARLALDLALYTAARRADIVALGPKNVEIEQDVAWLSFVQGKTGGAVDIPIIEQLALSIAATTPQGASAFLMTRQGRPYTPAGFGNAFRDWCDEAGLKGIAIHGVRKTAAAKLAELGCAEQEIQAITGHASSREVQRYTRSARRRMMAASAMKRLQESLSAPPTLPAPGAISPTLSGTDSEG